MRRLRAPLVLGAKCEWSSVASVRRLRRIVVCGVGKRRGALMRIEAQPSLSCASITERSSCPSDWSRANFPETHPHRVGHRPRGPTWLGHPVHMCGVDGMLRQSNSRTQLGQVLQLIGGGRRAVLLSPASSCNVLSVSELVTLGAAWCLAAGRWEAAVACRTEHVVQTWDVV